MKKDFTTMNTERAAAQTGGNVESAIAQATSTRGQQGTASPQEQAERASELRTQGRKGCKAIRINMAFSPENHEFITVMAKASGRSMTVFTNQVIAAYRNEHPELMEQARAFLDTINSGAFSSLFDDNE